MFAVSFFCIIGTFLRVDMVDNRVEFWTNAKSFWYESNAGSGKVEHGLGLANVEWLTVGAN